MKKIAALLLALVVSIAMVACQSSPAPTTAPQQAAPTAAAAPKPVSPAPTTAPGAPAPTAAPKPAAPATAAPAQPAKPAATSTPVPAPSKRYEYFMGSTSTTSSHYLPAVASAKSINDRVPGVHVTVVETGGAHDNLKRAVLGDLDISLAMTPEAAAMAYYGKYQYSKPFPELRMWFNYIFTPTYFIVRADSGVKALTDLNGKKFSSGVAGSSSDTNTRIIFAALGIKPDWFIGSPADAVEAIKDRRIVGYVKTPAGMYTLDASTLDIQSFTPINILGYTDEQIKGALTALPGLSRFDVPAGAIKSLPNQPAFTSWGFTIGGFLTTKVPDNIGYLMTKAIVENWKKDMVSTFPAAGDFDPVKDTIRYLAAATNPAPLHAGVVRYFQEVGANVPASIIPPEYKK